MSRKTLGDLAEKLGDDVVASIESNGHRYMEVYFYLPDLKISDNGSVKSLSVAAYSSQAKDDILLHRLFGKVKDQS